MPRWVVGELLTGQITAELDVSSGKWARVLNGAGSVSSTVPLTSSYDSSGKRILDLRLHTSQWRSFIASIDVESGRVHEAGPIFGRPYNADTGQVEIAGAGMWAYLYRRVLARPLLPGQRLPDVSLDFMPTDGLSKGTIVKRMLELMASHPYGALPIDLPPDSPGSTERHYPGHDGALIGDRVKQMTEVLNGPDVMFEPYLFDDEHIRWNARIGTEEDPYVHSSGKETFQYSAPRSPASGLTTQEDSSRLTTRDFELGGGQTDEVLAGMAENTSLLERGWPLLESVVNRSSVSELSTLDDYAAERVVLGERPTELWTLKFSPRERPFVQAYNVGDFSQLKIKNDLWIPDGDYDVRIVGMSGDELDNEVGVTFQETTGLG